MFLSTSLSEALPTLRADPNSILRTEIIPQVTDYPVATNNMDNLQLLNNLTILCRDKKAFTQAGRVRKATALASFFLIWTRAQMNPVPSLAFNYNYSLPSIPPFRVIRPEHYQEFFDTFRSVKNTLIEIYEYLKPKSIENIVINVIKRDPKKICQYIMFNLEIEFKNIRHWPMQISQQEIANEFQQLKKIGRENPGRYKANSIKAAIREISMGRNLQLIGELIAYTESICNSFFSTKLHDVGASNIFYKKIYNLLIIQLSVAPPLYFYNISQQAEGRVHHRYDSYANLAWKPSYENVAHVGPAARQGITKRTLFYQLMLFLWQFAEPDFIQNIVIKACLDSNNRICTYLINEYREYVEEEYGEAFTMLLRT